ncbi:MAG: AAC(3) family N-acetyltransferase [Candidatus Zipacnadales bacterium]
MLSEPGDRLVEVRRSDVAQAAANVGIIAGDTVFFHSSLSSMGHVIGGAEAVIDGFLDAVGPNGTVAVPTLCHWQPEEEHLVFSRWDPVNSPSYVGRITETFRQRAGAFRSNHPTHSIAALGRRAAELTANHGSAGPRPSPFGEAAFAHVSPWQRLVDWNAAYCFIGVTFRVCTMVHYVEARLAERALERAAPHQREAFLEQFAGWMKAGPYPSIRVEDREVIEALLAAEGLVRYTQLGSATLRCCRARPLVERWIAIVEADPERWLPDEYLRWQRRLLEDKRP